MALYITECMWYGLRSGPNFLLHSEFQIYPKLYIKFRTTTLGNKLFKGEFIFYYNE